MKYKRFGELQIGDQFTTASGGQIPKSERIFQKISLTFAIDTQRKDGKYVRKHIPLSMPVVLQDKEKMIDIDEKDLIHEFES